MSRYAEGTSVGPERSRAELERLMKRFGATQFAYAWDEQIDMVAFQMSGRHVRLTLGRPSKNDPMIALTPAGRVRSESARDEAYEQEYRRRWRSLVAVVKAKLVAVEDGISTLEREFLADVMLPDGSTVGQWAQPQLDRAYAEGAMPALMPGSPTQRGG